MASRRNWRLHWGEGGGGRGGKRGTVHCFIPLCPPPHSPRGFAVAQNFTKRDSTITPATQATTFMKKTPRLLFTGRFGGLTGRPGDLIKNLETPGKTGRVGRYGFTSLSIFHSTLFAKRCTCHVIITLSLWSEVASTSGRFNLKEIFT